MASGCRSLTSRYCRMSGVSWGGRRMDHPRGYMGGMTSELGDVGDDVLLGLELALGGDGGVVVGVLADADAEEGAAAGDLRLNDVGLVTGGGELGDEVLGLRA